MNKLPITFVLVYNNLTKRDMSGWFQKLCIMIWMVLHFTLVGLVRGHCGLTVIALECSPWCPQFKTRPGTNDFLFHFPSRKNGMVYTHTFKIKEAEPRLLWKRCTWVHTVLQFLSHYLPTFHTLNHQKE